MSGRVCQTLDLGKQIDKDSLAKPPEIMYLLRNLTFELPSLLGVSIFQTFQLSGHSRTSNACQIVSRHGFTEKVGSGDVELPKPQKYESNRRVTSGFYSEEFIRLSSATRTVHFMQLLIFIDSIFTRRAQTSSVDSISLIRESCVPCLIY